MSLNLQWVDLQLKNKQSIKIVVFTFSLKRSSYLSKDFYSSSGNRTKWNNQEIKYECESSHCQVNCTEFTINDSCIWFFYPDIYTLWSVDRKVIFIFAFNFHQIEIFYKDSRLKSFEYILLWACLLISFL